MGRSVPRVRSLRSRPWALGFNAFGVNTWRFGGKNPSQRYLAGLQRWRCPSTQGGAALALGFLVCGLSGLKKVDMQAYFELDFSWLRKKRESSWPKCSRDGNTDASRDDSIWARIPSVLRSLGEWGSTSLGDFHRPIGDFYWSPACQSNEDTKKKAQGRG